MNDKKRLVKNKILKELYFEEGLTCADMSLKIHKSFPLTAKLIEELVNENLVIETGYAASTGGRRPLTYALQKNVMYLGIRSSCLCRSTPAPMDRTRERPSGRSHSIARRTPVGRV